MLWHLITFVAGLIQIATASHLLLAVHIRHSCVRLFLLIQFDTFKTESYDRNYDMVESAMNKHNMREQDME